LSALGEYIKVHTIDTGMSIKKVAAQAGVAFETARRVLRGQGNVTDDTLQALADAFPALNLRHMRELAGLDASERKPFEAPREWDLLTEEERRVLKSVGRQILKSSGRLDQAVDESGGEDADDVTRIP
jgi:transcriptional regulator with XRE-family HTH domain